MRPQADLQRAVEEPAAGADLDRDLEDIFEQPENKVAFEEVSARLNNIKLLARLCLVRSEKVKQARRLAEFHQINVRNEVQKHRLAKQLFVKETKRLVDWQELNPPYDDDGAEA